MTKGFLIQQNLLVKCINQPKQIVALDLNQWTYLLRMAKSSNLTSHLGWLIEQHNLHENLPFKVQQHFSSAKTIVVYRQRLAFWEINRLERALKSLKIKKILLKGGAYMVSDLPFSQGRLFADVDILIESASIENVEQVLLEQDWQSQKIDAYDQQYYRRWMHEIPPLRHSLRSIEVDIHHTIIPPVSRLRPDPALLINDSITVSRSDFKVLSPCDMFLHTAVHLFFDSDLDNRLRDLVDIDQLLRHFGSTIPGYFDELYNRANQLGLIRPCFYAIHFSTRFFETPIPSGMLQTYYREWRPCIFVSYLMDRLVPLALMPDEPDSRSLKVQFARSLLFIRSHFLRMPINLLLPHLIHKSRLRLEELFQNADS